MREITRTSAIDGDEELAVDGEIAGRQFGEVVEGEELGSVGFEERGD